MNPFRRKNYISLRLNDDLTSSIDDDLFTAIISNFPDIIHSVDADGRIIGVNKKASELLGYSREELIGKSVYEIYADAVIEEVKLGFSRLKKQGVIERVESKLKRKDGELIDVEMRSFSLYNTEGQFVKTFTITRDTRELIQLRNQLIQQSKLAAIGELASGIMHDIRNPLGLIISYNEQVLTDALADGDLAMIANCQKVIASAAERILRLSEHLRTFSRYDDEEPEWMSLNEIMNDCFLMLETRFFEAKAVIINRISDKSLRFCGKANQIEQVFINLLANACDAVKEHDRKCIEVDAYEEDGHVVVVIKDQGPGIKDEHKAHIFDAFYTTKPKGQGTGLGLSICAGIVKDHKGKLDFVSVEGEGSTFMITLPIKR